MLRENLTGRLLLFFGIALFFGTSYFLTGNQNFIFDALANAIACEAGEPERWFHSNHIPYPFFGVGWYRLETLFGYKGYAVYSLERFNSLLTAFGLGFLYLAACRFTSYKKAWILPFFLGSAYAVWHYAVDGYTMGAVPFFACLLLWYLAGLIEKDIPFSRLVAISFLSFLYIGVHALGVFHTLAVAWWLGSRAKVVEGPWLNRWRGHQGIQYFFLTGLMVLGSYLLIYFTVVRPKTSIGFLSWVIGYAAYHGLDKALDWPLIHFHPAVVIKGHWTGWQQSLIARFRGDMAKNLLAILAALAGVALIAWAFLRCRILEDKKRKFFWALVLWAALNSFVIGFWAPGDAGFRLHILFPLFLATLVALARERYFYWSLFLLGCVVFICNFSGPIYYDSFITNNKGHQLLKEIDAHLKENDHFICAQGDVPDIHGLRGYFFPHIKGGNLESRLFEFKEKSLHPMKSSLVRNLTQGRNVYLTETLLNPETQRRIEARFGLNPGEVSALLDLVNLTEGFQLSTGLKVYKAALKSGL